MQTLAIWENACRLLLAGASHHMFAQRLLLQEPVCRLEHNAMSKAWTRTAQSGIKHNDHEVTAHPQTQPYYCYKYNKCLYSRATSNRWESNCFDVFLVSQSQDILDCFLQIVYRGIIPPCRAVDMNHILCRQVVPIRDCSYERSKKIRLVFLHPGNFSNSIDINISNLTEPQVCQRGPHGQFNWQSDIFGLVAYFPTSSKGKLWVKGWERQEKPVWAAGGHRDLQNWCFSHFPRETGVRNYWQLWVWSKTTQCPKQCSKFMARPENAICDICKVNSSLHTSHQADT